MKIQKFPPLASICDAERAAATLDIHPQVLGTILKTFEVSYRALSIYYIFIGTFSQQAVIDHR
jgi:hypothetical protein